VPRSELKRDRRKEADVEASQSAPVDERHDPPSHKTFRKSFLEGIGWTAAGVALRLAFAGGTLAILSRLVEPETMGLYGVGWGAAALGYNVSRSGAAQGIIAMRSVEKAHLSAAQALSAGFAMSVGLALVLAAPSIESFYQMKGLAEAFVIGGLFVPLMCLPAVDMAVAQKELNFSRLAIFQTIAVVLASFTAIGFALTGYGLISLFALQGCIGPYTFILFRLFGRPLGLTRFRMAHVKAVWGIGGHLSLTGLTVVIMLNFPQLIMAKFVTAEALGYYTFGNRIIQLIGTQLGGLVGAVTYPTFASIQSDLKRVGRAYLASARYTVFAIYLCVLVLVVAPGAFLELYGGSQWVTGENILFFLAAAQLLMCLGSNVIPTFQAIGKPSAGWKLNIVVSAIQGTVVYVLARYGIDAVVQGLAVAGLLMPFVPYWLSRAAGFPFTDYMRSMLGIVLPVFPAIAIGIVLSTWARNFAPLPAFLIPACSAGLVFVGLTVFTDSHLRQRLSELAAYGRKGEWRRSRREK